MLKQVIPAQPGWFVVFQDNPPTDDTEPLYIGEAVVAWAICEIPLHKGPVGEFKVFCNPITATHGTYLGHEYFGLLRPDGKIEAYDVLYDSFEIAAKDCAPHPTAPRPSSVDSASGEEWNKASRAALSDENTTQEKADA